MSDVSNKFKIDKDIQDLTEGHKEFYKEYFSGKSNLKHIYSSLVKNGQFPKALFIACSDSRIDPAIITKAKPGDIFSVRNVANLVPPYQEDSSTYHGTSSAIEFGVTVLNISNVIVMGHSYCAGIRAIVEDVVQQTSEKKDAESKSNFSFVKSWINIARSTTENLVNNHLQDYQKDPNQFYNFCAKEVLKSSLDNLGNFPFVKEKVVKGELQLHAWYFDIESGEILNYDKSDQTYKKLW